MTIISVDNFRAAGRARGWDLTQQLRHSHDPYIPRHGTIPDNARTPAGERYPTIRQRLQYWQADLGARDRVDWAGFLRDYRNLLRPLIDLPRLGGLSAREINVVVDVVDGLERYKQTSGRALVFGSKTAHFHFPWLVPIVSSEVRRGLLELQRTKASVLASHLPAKASWFRFATAAETRRSYRNYVLLGNALMRPVNGAAFHRKPPSYGIDAKIFEWCVVAFDPALNRP